MEASRVIVGIERPPSALDLDRARHKADERRRRRNRRARGISCYIAHGRLLFGAAAAGEKILVPRDILVLDMSLLQNSSNAANFPCVRGGGAAGAQAGAGLSWVTRSI